MKLLLKIVVGLIVLFAIAITIGYFSGNDRYYYLSVVNSTNEPASVSVSLSEQKIELNAGESKTVKIEKQKDKDVKAPRKFEVKYGANSETLESPVEYAGDMVLDITGDSCLVAADYGRQYRGELPLAEGETDIIIKQVFQGKKIFAVPGFPVEERKMTMYVDVMPGDKLPENVKSDPGVMPVQIRLMALPCDLLDDSEGLYNYLNVN
ncbi:MAG: hypothetical protein ACD_73C00448G0001 [uncultured bacterium]|nr:MAG: hypothetical protein ACD_73C00448G0001 [uncultured bacterium]